MPGRRGRRPTSARKTSSSSAKWVKTCAIRPGTPPVGGEGRGRRRWSRRRAAPSSRWSAPRSCRRAGPCPGACASSTAPSPRTATKAAPRRSGFSAFGRATGKRSGSPEPSARAIVAQRAEHAGGRRGVQIVAPRSIIAWAKSPGRASGTSVSTSARISRLGLGQRRLDRVEPRDRPARHCRRPPRPAGRRRSRRSPPPCRRRCPAASRRPSTVSGNAAAVPRGDEIGAFLQIAGPRIIAEPGPGLHDVVGLGRGQRRRRRASARRRRGNRASPPRPSSAAA